MSSHKSLTCEAMSPHLHCYHLLWFKSFRKTDRLPNANGLPFTGSFFLWYKKFIETKNNTDPKNPIKFNPNVIHAYPSKSSLRNINYKKELQSLLIARMNTFQTRKTSSLTARSVPTMPYRSHCTGKGGGTPTSSKSVHQMSYWWGHHHPVLGGGCPLSGPRSGGGCTPYLVPGGGGGLGTPCLIPGGGAPCPVPGPVRGCLLSSARSSGGYP